MENQGCPSQVQSNQDQHNQKLRAENQKLRAESQEIRTRMGTVEAQMAELKKFLLTWKGKDASEGAITAVAGANHGDIPSVTNEPVQVTSAEANKETGGHAFLKWFNHNIAKAPSRAQLQSMAQGNKETFREYALRWKDLAAQVKPPLPKREMVDIFMNTLSSLYHDQLAESIYGNLENLVPAEESLGNKVKKRKTAHSSTDATPIAGPGNASYSPETFLQIPHSYPQTRKSQETPYYPKRKHVQFDPIPISHTDLFNYLYTNKLINTRSMRPVQPPYFRGYNPNATCAFHNGAIGHFVETCKAFKLVVQDMLDSKYIAFRQEDPDITAVNCSGAKKNEEISAAADKGKAPQCDSAPTCEFHSGAIGHSVESCSTLRHLIQGLIDTHQLTFEKGEGSSSQGLWTIKQG